LASPEPRLPSSPEIADICLSGAPVGGAARRHPQYPTEPTYNPARAALPAIRGDIAFEHVTFRYRIDGPEVLHDVSFSIPAGQIVGVVGPSGSGKSTLAKLIQRLYVQESGRVLVDGVALTMVDTSWVVGPIISCRS
jgi:ABC-type bacteriocin/lantibiotic exporter with double-glycine peptidase domain